MWVALASAPSVDNLESASPAGALCLCGAPHQNWTWMIKVSIMRVGHTCLVALKSTWVRCDWYWLWIGYLWDIGVEDGLPKPLPGTSSVYCEAYARQLWESWTNIQLASWYLSVAFRAGCTLSASHKHRRREPDAHSLSVMSALAAKSVRSWVFPERRIRFCRIKETLRAGLSIAP